MKKTVQQEMSEIERELLELQLRILKTENRGYGEMLAKNRKQIQAIKEKLKDNIEKETSLFPPF